MAADRTVTYTFRGNASHLSREMAKVGAEMQALDGRLEDADRNTVLLQRDSNRLANNGIRPLGNAARSASADINTFSGRLGLLATAATTLGPALVPLSTVAVPAVAGLASGFGALAGAAGVSMLAFNGVGDSLSALNEYQLNPSAENLAAMREEFDKLGESGVEFVRYLDSLGPQLEQLQRTAGDGMFPGMQDGLESAVTLMPQVRDLVSDLSSTMGDLARDAGDSLATDGDWQRFFDYLATDAAPTLDALGRSLGNFTSGLANMMVGFAPLSRDFTSYMLDMSESFREWSAGLGDNQEFQDFISYIREQGPAVGEFFSSLVSAVSSLAQAMAPWGEAVLPVLTQTLDLFSSIAGSDIGPALFTAGAAFLAFNKTMSLTAATMSRFGAGGPGGVQGASGVFGAMGAGAEKARGSITGFGRDIRKMSGEYRNLGRASSTALSAFSGTSAAAQRTRESLGRVASGAGKAGGAVAGLAFATSGAAEGMGLTNAASLGLMGTIAGPWGAAIGTGAGLMMDMAAANNDAESAVRDFNAALQTTDYNAISQGLANVKAEFSAFVDETQTLSPAAVKNGWEGIFGRSDVEEAREEYRAAVEDIQEIGASISYVASQTGEKSFLPTNAEDQARVLERMAPAMRELGLSAEDLATASPETLDKLIAKMETASGAAGTLRQQVEQTNQAFLAGFSAITSWGESLGQAVRKGAGLDALTEAGRENRRVVESVIGSYNQLEGAAAQSVGKYQRTAREIRRIGRAAGLSDRQIGNLIGKLNQPHRLQFTDNTLSTKARVKSLEALLKGLPSTVVTDMKLNGVPRSEADIKRLQRQYDLTPAQVRTLATLRDNASGNLRGVNNLLDQVDGRHARSSVTNTITTIRRTIALGASALQAGLSNAEGGMYRNNVRTYADGGLDRAGRHEPQIAAPSHNTVRVWAEPETQGESYIPHANDHRRPRAKDILEQTAAMFGGQVAWFAEGGSMSPRQVQTSRPAPVGSIGGAPATVRRAGRPWDGRLTLMVDGEAIGGVIAEIASGQVEASELMAAEHARAL